MSYTLTVNGLSNTQGNSAGLVETTVMASNIAAQAGVPDPVFGVSTPTFLYLTGVLLNSSGKPQTVPITAAGSVSNAKQVGHVDPATQLHQKLNIIVDASTKAAFIAAGLLANDNNMQVNWLPFSVTTSGTLPIVFEDLINCSATGNSLTCTGGLSAFDAGACSSLAIVGNGYASWTYGPSTSSIQSGLASTDPMGGNLAAIDYAFGTDGSQIGNPGSVGINEGSDYSPPGAPTNLTLHSGDTFKIQVTGSVVTYYQNGTLVYTSTVPYNGQPLAYAANIYPRDTTSTVVTAATISGSVLQSFGSGGGGNMGTWSGGKWDGNKTIAFTDTSANIPAGALPIVIGQPFTVSQIVGNSKGSYQAWLYDSTGKNGNAISVQGQLDYDLDRTDQFNPPPIMALRLDSAYGVDTFSGNAFGGVKLDNSQNYNLSLALTGATYSKATNMLTISNANASSMFYGGWDYLQNIQVQGTAGGTHQALWNGGLGAGFFTDLVNVSNSGTSLTCTGGLFAFDAGAVSGQALVGNGYTSWTYGPSTSSLQCGLSTTDPMGGNLSAINYAFGTDGSQIGNPGSVGINEGSDYSPPGAPTNLTLNAGDTFKIQVTGSVVTYYQNNTLVYTSTVPYDGVTPLALGCNIYPRDTTSTVLTNAALSGTLVPFGTSGAPATLTFLDTPPSNFAGPFTITQKTKANNTNLVLCLNPTTYATGYIKVKYSGKIDQTVGIQMIYSTEAYNGNMGSPMAWPPSDETLSGNAYMPSTGNMAVPLEVTIDGSGNTTITCPFTITTP